MSHKYSGGFAHIHTHADHDSIDNHTCHCFVCKGVTGQATTQRVFFKYGYGAVDNEAGLKRQPFYANNPDGPLDLCTYGDCGAPILVDDKHNRIRAIVPSLMGYGDKIAPAPYHAFYDPVSGAPKPSDGRPIYKALRPDFEWPTPS
ncbi:hypothetical protein RA2_02350 [Roseovarius sp. A-2]|uniref:hypothetical protein n=1 Tax=Roseovarius sp. A-2 TaxID=1570360 RepID=UPI0009B554B5|nr:hypothetical protein [Roseovarius sp. A-2]GAW35289.1 hypothetical protein RA2_02350 [Roseovarius sp. A-2]